MSSAAGHPIAPARPVAARAPAPADVPAPEPIRGHRPPSLLDDIRTFAAFGTPTVESRQEGIPYFVNEFWTSGQRQAHAIHEVSYRACFKPQLPAFFIDRLTDPGDGVHDPFAGRGTTPVQAALMGRRPLANDINPLSALLTRPRLAPPSPEAVAARLATIDWDAPVAVRDDLLVFYHPTTLRHLANLRHWLLARAPLDDADPDPVVDWIRMVAINRLTGTRPASSPSTRCRPTRRSVSRPSAGSTPSVRRCRRRATWQRSS